MKIRSLAAVTLAAMLLLAGLVTAAFADHVSFVGHDGSAGTNETPFWVNYGATEEGEDDWVCHKIDDSMASFTLTDGALVEGNVWRLLVINAGPPETANALFWNPVIGEEYQHPVTGDVSHLILCQRPEPEDGDDNGNGDNGEENGEDNDNGSGDDNGTDDVVVEDVVIEAEEDEDPDEAEVLAEVLEADDEADEDEDAAVRPTRVDAGDGGLLPSGGGIAGLVALLLTGLGLTLSGLHLRRTRL